MKKPGAMTCVRCCKGLASVRDIRVPHVHKMQQGKSRKDFQLYKFLPLPVCFALVKVVFLSCLFRLI